MGEGFFSRPEPRITRILYEFFGFLVGVGFDAQPTGAAVVACCGVWVVFLKIDLIL